MSFRSNIIKANLDQMPALAGIELAYIGIGSNLHSRHGEPVQVLESALNAIALWSASPVLVSSFWESTPVDCPPDSPRFVNAVAAIVPGEISPRDLLLRLQALELEFGRVRSGVRNAPRTLDLDILSFGNRELQEETLTLPHPRMHERAFVLRPLLEIAPHYRIPGFMLPADELLAQIVDQGTLSVINFDKCL